MQTSTSRRPVRCLSLALLVVALLVPLTAAPAPSATPAPRGVLAQASRHDEGASAARASDRADRPHFAPGRFGALKVGMKPRQALRTGMARWVDEGPGCGRYLQMRPRYSHAFLSFYKRTEYGGNNRIVLLGAYDDHYRTTEHVGVGSTRRAVRRAYGSRLSRGHVNDYGQYAFDVRGRHRTFLTFVVNGSSPSSRVGQLLIAKGRPVHLYEGESPC